MEEDCVIIRMSLITEGRGRKGAKLPGHASDAIGRRVYNVMVTYMSRKGMRMDEHGAILAIGLITEKKSFPG